MSELSGKISEDCHGWNGSKENHAAALEKTHLNQLIKVVCYNYMWWGV
jgi:hypothetical protein